MFSYPPGREPTRRWWTPPEDIHEQALRGWSPSPGKLQKLLQMPEYNLFGGAQIFESNFLQVTKSGQFVNIHKHPNVVTVGILASSPRMLLPDLMIIAREKQGTAGKKQRSRALEITRLIPLDLVEIFVCDAKKRQLKVQLATGQRYYLQLTASEREADLLFERWVRLIYLTRVATGKIKTPENFPSKNTELHTVWRGSALQAKLTKRPPSRQQVPHSAPKVKKQSEAKQSAKVQAKSLKQSPSKWTSPRSSVRFPAELKHSEAFISRPPELTAAAGQLKNVRQPNLEKKKCSLLEISSESNPIPVTLQKSKKEMCLLQKNTMTSSSKQSPEAIRKKEPTSRDRSPGPSKSPGPPSHRKEEPAVQSRSPKHNQRESFSNASPETGHPVSQEKETGQQVHRVTMSIAVGTSQVSWKTVAVGPSAAIDPDLSNPLNQLSRPKKSHKEPRKARGKKEIIRSQLPEPKNRLKMLISTAKQKSSLKFVTLYSMLSSSVERLKKSKTTADSKHVTPKTSKRVTISGVVAQSRKSIVLQEERIVSPPGTPRLDGNSKEAATGVAKEDFPPSSQPQKSMNKPQTSAAREGFSGTAEPLRSGNQIAAKGPGVTSITSQAPFRNTRVEQGSVPGLETQKATKKALTASRIAEKPRTVITTPLKPRREPPPVKLSHPKLTPKSPQSRKAPRKT